VVGVVAVVGLNDLLVVVNRGVESDKLRVICSVHNEIRLSLAFLLDLGKRLFSATSRQNR